ncbi:MAG: hypothetical protein MUF24_05950 [Chitinophagaceae bacterium]|nr:hypothetical protein [Chitinophagaceae bacterium]
MCKGLMMWVIAMFFGVGLLAQHHCPVNFNGQGLDSLRSNPRSWLGKMMAVNGVIKQVEKGYEGKPYFNIGLEGGGELWISGQVTLDGAAVGSKVRVLGFFERTKRAYMPPRVNDDGFHLISFVIYDLDRHQMIMRPGQEDIVQEWIDGRIPMPGKRIWEQ